MPSGGLDFYPALRLQRLGSVTIIQPEHDGTGPHPPSLTVDLETGSVAASEHPLIASNYTACLGVMGMLRFEAGPALVVITGAVPVRGGVIQMFLLLLKMWDPIFWVFCRSPKQGCCLDHEPLYSRASFPSFARWRWCAASCCSRSRRVRC